jgi:hypothetical protein
MIDINSGLTRKGQIALVAELNASVGQLISGTNPQMNLLAVAGDLFPQIPVKPGETYLVLIEGTGTSVLYFE